MIDEEKLNYELLELLKKHKKTVYQKYKKYLEQNQNNLYINNKIKKHCLNLYTKSMSKDKLYSLNQINKSIETFINNVQFATLCRFDETQIIDKSPYYNYPLLNDNSLIIGLRDQNGFYGINDNIKNLLQTNKEEINILHNLICNKEDLMNGRHYINPGTLNRKEAIILANYLGYSDVREGILDKQSRNKVLTKKQG